ncbi:MAG: SRPBCC family protein [Acidiferrobacterales bacterium]
MRNSSVALLFALSLLVAVPADAVTIRDLEVTHHDGTYLVVFDVLVDVPQARARAMLLDYRQWPQLSDTLKETRLLTTFPDGRQRIWLSSRACVLVFCRKIQQVKDLVEDSNGDIVIKFVHGDFQSGWERWRIRSEQDRIRVQYRAELAPSFYIPPVIGSWLLKANLRTKVIVTAEKMEALSSGN